MATRSSFVPASIVAAALLIGCGGENARTASLPPSGATSFGKGHAPVEPATHFVPDRIIVIVMENHSFDDVIGRTDPSGNRLVTPFLTQAALTDRLATLAFGVAHPSLPNYLSMIAGDYFGVHDDNGSCYAP
ncbi:MAG: hypothetical protein JO146_07120, partial [Candidatus Eremiobacteraeota bacterium]|nr:hypothetical protein [Candidatus Eremiobacteraeota bacterium]